MRNFVSPHVHLSSLDTGATIENFAKREKELETGYLVCTDHGHMASARTVTNIAKKHGLTAINGCEFYLRDDDCEILKGAGIQKADDGTFRNFFKYVHVTGHFLDNDAFECASRLISKADERAEKHGSERKPLFSWNDLEELGGHNTTFCSSCLIGIVGRLIVGNNRPDLAIKYYEKMRGITKPGNFYVELFPHQCTHYWEQGTFITFADGSRSRYHKTKTVRTTLGEHKLDDLIPLLRNQTATLLAVKNYSTWADVEPKEIKNIEHVEGFLQNECRPWAPSGDLQYGINQFVLRLANKYKDKILISDDAHFAYPKDKTAQDVRLMAGGGSWRFHNSYHRQGSDEAWAYFRDVMKVSESQFESWVENSHEWAGRFKDFKFKKRVSLPTKFYPDDSLRHTMNLIKQHGRMDWSNPAYVERLKAEISLLHKNGTIDLLPYFFVDEEVCRIHAENGYLTGPARGSVGGLLLPYLLEITHIDPIKHQLSMDRFLTLDRIQSGKLPDIDLDLPTREFLTGPEGDAGWLKDRFGDHACQVSTDIMLKIKSAIKDVARVKYGRVPYELEELTKKITVAPQGVTDKDFIFGYTGPDGEYVEGSIKTDPYLQQYIKQYPDDWEDVQMVIGLVRSRSRHACAYLICNEPIQNFIPTSDIGGIRSTQYTAGSAEEAGALKYDFLVVNSLKDIADAVKLIQQHQGVTLDQYVEIDGRRIPSLRALPFGGRLYDVWRLPNDQAVFNDICESDTETVFQFNTPAARQWLAHFNDLKAGTEHKLLDSIDALADFTALDRPGPLDAMMTDETGDEHNMLVEYARRAKLGKGNYKSDLPILDELLPETYGIIVYQEQLTRIFKEMGGTTGMEAENFRVHISKKQMAKVTQDREIFMRGAVEKVGQETATRLWDMMCTFASYGFCCIDGSQKIQTDKGNVTMSEIVARPLDYKVAYLDANGAVGFETPSWATAKGEKEVFEVELEDGTTILATKDHKFQFNDQWITLEEGVLLGTFCANREAKKVLSCKSLGVRMVYDIEMPTNHNFILDNGVVAHNCAHAVGYSYVSYSCAFLKHHYPLEWWTAVLCNADKNEIYEKFWIHCGHLINLPEIKLSGDNFKVVNGRIQAPTSLLQGIGEAAHQELIEVAKDATDLDSLLREIQNRKDRLSTVDATGKKTNGRSSLNRRIMYTLLISGTMDSFFPADYTMLDKLSAYERAIAARDSVGKKKAKKPKAIDEAYLSLDRAAIFQLRKQLLPAYSEDTISLCQPLTEDLTAVGDKLYYAYRGPDQSRVLKVATSADLHKYDAHAVWPRGHSITVAVPCYVQDDERRLYGSPKKEMAKLMLDIGGERREFVMWPNRETGVLPDFMESNVKGAVAVAILHKYSQEKPFLVENLVILRKPFNPKEEASE